MACHVMASMTRRVVGYDQQMRWAPDARERLTTAALELFSERGYDQTTVPQITAQAGLTTRTFFRYFTDKREVIFGGSEIPETAARLIREAPPGPAADTVRSVLHQVAAAQFEGRKEETAAWRRLIEANDSLRDRDARKRADLVQAATLAFIDRGDSRLHAVLHAETGALVFHVALDHWIAQPTDQTLTEVLDMVSDELGLAKPT